VLGAWKFQQGKFCNFGKSGLGFLGNFCFCFQPRKASVFPAKRGHTCEERGEERRTQERREKATHVWNRLYNSLYRSAHMCEYNRSVQSHVWYNMSIQSHV
jgi:hypothetical protein